MKNQLQYLVKAVLLLTVFCSLNTAFGQAPQKMSYQAVVRNTANSLVANTLVGVKISVLQTTATGTVVYSERHTPTTNANGLATFEIGGGTILSGTMAGINWANGPYFIKTETDPAGGTNYTIAATSQLASVPYALFAANGGTPGPAGATGATGAQGIQGVAGAVGANGKNTLILTTTEPVGANCPTGGTRQQYGIDTSGNGALEPSEINAALTKYVCNGLAGATGAQGPAGTATNAWGLNGTAGTTATSFIGTTDNKPVVIKANNLEIARAAANGTMTIGLGNPDPLNTVSLAVKGDVAVYDGGKIKVSEYNDIGFFEVLNATKNSIQATTIDPSNIPDPAPLLINPNGGSVGIATAGAVLQNKLQIGNPPGFSGNDIAIGNGTQAMSLFQSPTASTFFTNTNFAFMPANGIGNVGINTTEPTSKLQVNGSAASSFKLITADYTADETDNIIYANKQFDATTNLTITLPLPASCVGRIYHIKAIALPELSAGGSYVYDADGYYSDVGYIIPNPVGVVTIKNHLGQDMTYLNNSYFVSGANPYYSRTSVCVQSIGLRWIVVSSDFDQF